MGSVWLIYLPWLSPQLSRTTPCHASRLRSLNPRDQAFLVAPRSGRSNPRNQARKSSQNPTPSRALPPILSLPPLLPSPLRNLSTPVSIVSMGFTLFFFFLLLKLVVGWVLTFQHWWAVKKGQIVRVDKEKYLNSINVSLPEHVWRNGMLFVYHEEGRGIGLISIHKNLIHSLLWLQYLSVGHPPYYKGLDYIYEDRGEVRIGICRQAGHFKFIVVLTVLPWCINACFRCWIYVFLRQESMLWLVACILTPCFHIHWFPFLWLPC